MQVHSPVLCISRHLNFERRQNFTKRVLCRLTCERVHVVCTSRRGSILRGLITRRAYIPISVHESYATFKCKRILTCERVHKVVTSAGAHIDSFGALLDEPNHFVEIAEGELVILEEALRSRVRVL